MGEKSYKLTKYEKENQKSGMVTTVWGSPAWLFLHIISFNYCKELKYGYMQFFKSLGQVLPCAKCRENYKRIISKGPLKLTDTIFKNRESFSKWLFLVHNKVQSDIYEKSKLKCNIPMYKNTEEDYNKVRKYYEQFRAKSCVKQSYGCTKPKKGMRLRTRICIKPLTKKCMRQKCAITIKKI